MLLLFYSSSHNFVWLIHSLGFDQSGFISSNSHVYNAKHHSHSSGRVCSRLRRGSRHVARVQLNWLKVKIEEELIKCVERVWESWRVNSTFRFLRNCAYDSHCPLFICSVYCLANDEWKILCADFAQSVSIFELVRSIRTICYLRLLFIYCRVFWFIYMSFQVWHQIWHQE